MPPTPPNQRMGALHEAHLAEIFEGYQTPGSGNGADKGDGATHHDDPFAFRWDGKSTKTKTLSLDRAQTVELICEQAGGERPALGLRWYGNEALTTVLHDWIAIKDVDFSEMRGAARSWAAVVAFLRSAGLVEGVSDPDAETVTAVLGVMMLGATMRDDTASQSEAAARQELAQARAELETERQRAHQLNEAYRRLLDEREHRTTQTAEGIPLHQPGTVGDDQPFVPPHVLGLPWVMVTQIHLEGRVVNSGMYYDERGHMQSFGVESVIVEREIDNSNRPRLIVNGGKVAQGALYVDGYATVIVSPHMPGREKG